MAKKPPPNIDPRWAWQRYEPSRTVPWDLKRAGHLYRRAAFGATLTQLDEAVRLGPQRAIDQLVRGGDDPDRFVAAMDERVPSIRQADSGDSASAWWLYRMMYSPNPLKEKLTLFWHNHFATSNRKVNNAGYMLDQYALLYRHAQGSFRTLLRDMSSDKAMMVWLDTNESQRDRPNENYARELMELFSLGRHNPRRPNQRNYTEQDVRQAARAFTGWRIDNGRAVFRDGDHDGGEKNVLGQRGRFRADDIVRICLEQEACPYFVASKLFKFLVSETVPATAELLQPLAAAFRENDFDFGAMVETVLRSNLFFSEHAYRTKIKGPLDFAASIIRGLEGRVGTLQLVPVLDGLGQRPFYPPSVAGWDGGRAWLNGQTLLFRQNLSLALTSTTDDRFGRRCDPAALARRHNATTDDQVIDLFLRLFLQSDVPAAGRHSLVEYAREARTQRVPVYWTAEDVADQRVRALCHLVLTMPEFQLD